MPHPRPRPAWARAIAWAVGLGLASTGLLPAGGPLPGPAALPAVEVAVDPDLEASSAKSQRLAPIAHLSPSGVGNEVYRLFVDGPGESNCGTWTATTGALHPVGPGRNVLYGNGDPNTSDTTLWSWSTNTGYRTGTSGGCTEMCDEDPPSVQGLFRSGTQVGWRLTWRITDGPHVIDFIQEVEVVGPVDGTQDAENSSIRETHVVRNVGGTTFEFGLRKHWDWQIGDDDGPHFATCDRVTAGCDRALNFFESGAGAGVYPATYAINDDPLDGWCPPGFPPNDADGCFGSPLWIIAGTVSPPSSLVPPPDPPELLQFNHWNRLVNHCWNPLMQDPANCSDATSPANDSAIAYFYGLTASSALQVGPGEERSFTQYVVAAEDECPEIVAEPAADCDAGGPYERPCTGPLATVQMQATATVSEGEPIITWTHDCPGGSFDDPAVEDPILTYDFDGCRLGCSVTMNVRSSEGGGSATCSTTVVFSDEQPPSLSCPLPLTMPCSNGGVLASDPAVQAWLASAVASDACGGVTITHDMPAFVPAAGCLTQRLVTWTARDACGNASSCATSLFIVDDRPPVVTPPADSDLDCGDPPGDQAAWRAGATAVDECGGALPVTSRLLSTTSPCPGTTVETWEFSATDACGLTGLATATWSVGDASPPVVTPPDPATIPCGPSSDAAEQSWLAQATALDECQGARPIVRTLIEVIPGDCAGEEIRRWRFSADDGCGNAAEAIAELTLVDDAAPSLHGVPSDETVSCDAIPPAPVVTASDACDPGPAVILAETVEPGPCPQERTIVRTWTARDACGNESSLAQRLAVVDDAAPALVGVPADTTVSCDAIPVAPAVTANDACDPAPVVILAETIEPGPCPQERTIVRTWTARDACGNESSLAQRLTVVDDEAPALQGVPSDATVSCDAIPPAPAVTADDACDPAPVVTLSETIEPGACPQERAIIRTWTARDACGNESSLAQRLTVVDDAAPNLVGVPPDATVSCDAIPPAPAVTADDACDPAPVVTFAEAIEAAACPQERTIVRTWTARDACGNESSRTQRLAVVDDAAPVLIGVPATVVVDCSEIPDPAVVTASDACDPSPVVTFAETVEPGRCPQERVLIRTWTARDACGNAASAVQRVAVRDMLPPVLVGVPADQVVSCDAIPGPAPVTAIDACDPFPTVTFTEVETPGACPQERILVRHWHAADACGGSVDDSQTIVIRDTSAPVLAGIPADATASCTTVPPPAPVTATDACDPSPSVSLDEQRLVDPACPDSFTLIRTWTATDACGNESEARQRIDVRDDEPPSFVGAPADVTVPCDAVPAPAPLGWIDDCAPPGIALPSETITPGACPNAWTSTRTWTAVDRCGNAATHVQVVTVVDVTPPDLAPPPDVEAECPAPASGPGSEAAWIASASATDTCGPATVESRELAREPGCGGTLRVVREFWAVDACGLESARAVREYRIVDTTPPVFSRPGDQFAFALWPPNHGYVVFAVADVASASDACGGVTVRVTGCASDQPEDVHQGRGEDGVNGDGRTFEDCVIALDGSAFAVRSERDGACGKSSQRTYALELTATDDCGNEATAPGRVVVGHDRSGHEPVSPRRPLPPNAPPPFPHAHPTTYGEGCGTR